jgi:hypothetical protein
VTTVAVNLTGCMGMNSFTFSLTVGSEEPMSEQEIKDYLWAIIESRDKLAVLNIVRDY